MQKSCGQSHCSCTIMSHSRCHSSSGNIQEIIIQAQVRLYLPHFTRCTYINVTLGPAPLPHPISPRPKLSIPSSRNYTQPPSSSLPLSSYCRPLTAHSTLRKSVRGPGHCASSGPRSPIMQHKWERGRCLYSRLRKGAQCGLRAGRRESTQR